jgi:hypothetical protein
LLDLRHERRRFVEPIQDRDPDPVAMKQRCGEATYVEPGGRLSARMSHSSVMRRTSESRSSRVGTEPDLVRHSPASRVQSAIRQRTDEHKRSTTYATDG